MKTLSDFYRLFPSHPAMIDRNARAIAPQAIPAPATVAPPANDDTREADAIRRYRARDYGTGYGRSSGYASKQTSYLRGWRPGIFKLR